MPVIIPNSKLDTLGLLCPVPVLKTARRIRDLEVGQILEVLSDDPMILIDIPAWCESNGHEYLGHEDGGTELHLWVRRTH